MTKTNLRLFPSPLHLAVYVTIILASGLMLNSSVLASDYYPPRISHVDGSAAYIPAGKVDWEGVSVNIPMLDGDRIFAQADSRIEIELGDANFLRLADETDLTFNATLEKEIQLRLDEGVLILRLNESRRIRIQTPYATVEMRKKGLYRVGVDDSGQMQVIVRKGRADIESAGGTKRLNDGEELVLGARYQGPMQVSQYSYQDEFDRWSDRRDAGYMNSRSVAYVGGSYYPGVYDLDRYGYWTSYPGYGRVWVPHVSFGWSPYSSGFWSSFGFGFGWTWISYEPWGWLPYHYGNWHYYSPHHRWCWIPGGFRHWSPHRVHFYHGGGYVGWAPTPHGFGNNNSVTVINNNTVVNRPPRDGLTIVRQEDFGTRRGSSDRALNASRAVVGSFRTGLPENLATRRDAVRQADSGLNSAAKRTTASTAAGRSVGQARGDSESQPTAASRAQSRTNVARGTTPVQRDRSTTGRETGTPRVLRAGGAETSRSSSPPPAATQPSRTSRITPRERSSDQPDRNSRIDRSPAPAPSRKETVPPAEARITGTPPARTASSEANSTRSVQRISRGAGQSSSTASFRLRGESKVDSGRNTSPQSYSRGYSSQPGSSPSRSAIARPTVRSGNKSTVERSYSRPSTPIPSVRSNRSRSVAPSSNRSFSSREAPSRSGSYSRPSAPSRSGPSSRSPAPSRGRSSNRSRPD